MTRLPPVLLLLALLVTLSCNLVRQAFTAPTSTPAPTETPTATLPPTPAPTPTVPPLPAVIPPVPTQAPPTAAPTEVLAPTAPPEASPTSPAAYVTEPPPPTLAPTATEGYPIPEERALFEGTFTGGQLSFRIGADATTVIPKSVILKGATCKEGGKINYAIDFEPPPEYKIVKGAFLINYGNTVAIFGQFQGRDRVLGNVTVRVVLDGGVCNVGPLPYAATP